ncbi:uncharacterized protein EI90DRAFT_2913754 [Cantharellus anzutake]|uniref:uncharacterized protein n=1 Tax=Cantharellus anzutake TaxID=1750568 RepID=UPI0019066AD5|nr:uncharacterized protein EI90DRAFT_2913754 [Cantharellus anzutake]KAF8334974.1 hypothetical protein EI90DRAFT_2913754 [Cantharellus anzutake]
MRSLFIAGASSTTFEKPFFGSWNRLLNAMFSPDILFEVVPQFPPATSSRDTVDLVILLLVHVNTSPVFIVEVKPPAEFHRNSKQQEADSQMRQHFLDMAADMQIPVFYSVPAFDMRITFYKYVKAANMLELKRITPIHSF